ncbi:hypothetical protein WJ78_17315 [Burkholderia ubonensis]|nr:hypothetical protein WI84_14345 [Burkholderia ubonensis]KVD78487.1 hypothetical protein WI89_30640 [Burkholderia ubonensis]KVO64889.1 hypothetical protein WJ78_17315 [Burkholderia ubonensis]KVP89887.1 hypothetical protein WJ97_23105 [Burkholderia ubonensis]KVQ08343.1 hypothetical protein WJ99_23245 [Burkholderia ubonensis]
MLICFVQGIQLLAPKLRTDRLDNCPLFGDSRTKLSQMTLLCRKLVFLLKSSLLLGEIIVARDIVIGSEIPVVVCLAPCQR